LGNLVNRVLNMTTRFAGGIVPAAEIEEEPERDLKAAWNKTKDEFITLSEGFQFHLALERAFGFFTAVNGYIEKRAPFKLAKLTDARDQALLRTSLATIAEGLRCGVSLLPAVMPETTQKIYAVLAYTPAPVWREDLGWGSALLGHKVAEALILFPRPESSAPANEKKKV
jgi:methionyl-tRNA synthetase